MKWIKSNESKGIFFSLLIHSTLLTALLMSNDKPIKLADKEKTVSIDLISYQPPKPVEKQKTIKKPKPIEKPKPIKKTEPQHKPIVHKKTEPEPEPEPIQKEIKENIKEIVKPTPIIPEEVIKPQNTTHNKQTQQHTFIKTNFEIIRDMVLSNLKYPNIARRMGWTGIVEVKLQINKFGKLITYSIYKSSGKKNLDQAALKAVQGIAHKNLPIPNQSTTIILPISFQL